MIVCVCRRVSDHQIRQAVARGVTDFDSLVLETGASSQCGACRGCAQEVFMNARNGCSACPQACALATKGQAPVECLPVDLAERR